MQENNQNSVKSEDEQFKEFKRLKKQEEAKSNVLKIECDCLSPVIDRAALKSICKDANALSLGAVVVFPAYVKSCVSYLGNDPQVSLIAAVDYPYGGELTEVKTLAVKRAVKDGVDEVEVLAPVALLREDNYVYFKKECKKLKRAAKNCALRIVFDCAMLTEKQLVKAAVTAADAGANCLRLNNADGETISKVKAALKGKCLIKADGAESALDFANLQVAGADTVGCKNALDFARYLLNEAESE